MVMDQFKCTIIKFGATIFASGGRKYNMELKTAFSGSKKKFWLY